MFQEFPYTNFHELNLDWIVKIAKDFLDQYTHIQEVIQTGLSDIAESRETGLEELNQKTIDGLADLQEKYDTLNGLLQEWYNTHSADIAGQLAAAIADFNAAAEAKSQALLDSWPDDYSELVTAYNALKNAITYSDSNVNTSSDLWQLNNDASYTRLETKEFLSEYGYQFIISDIDYQVAMAVYEGDTLRGYIVPSDQSQLVDTVAYFTLTESPIDLSKWTWTYKVKPIMRHRSGGSNIPADLADYDKVEIKKIIAPWDIVDNRRITEATANKVTYGNILTDGSDLNDIPDGISLTTGNHTYLNAPENEPSLSGSIEQFTYGNIKLQMIHNTAKAVRTEYSRYKLSSTWYAWMPVNITERMMYNAYNPVPDKVAILKNGTDWYIRSRFDDTYDFVYYCGAPWQNGNYLFNPLSCKKISRSAQLSDTATRYSAASLYKDCTDDIPAILYNGNAIGANHGCSEFTKLVCTHSLTETSIGTEWTDNNGDKCVIVQVFEDYLVVGYVDDDWLVVKTPTSIEYYGVTITIVSSEAIQLRRSAIHKELYSYDNNMRFIDYGYSDCIKVVEKYDIVHPVGLIGWLKLNAGTLDNTSYYSDDIPESATIGTIVIKYVFYELGRMTWTSDFISRKNFTWTRVHGVLATYFNGNNYGAVPGSSNMATPVDVSEQTIYIRHSGVAPYDYFLFTGQNSGNGWYINYINNCGSMDNTERANLNNDGRYRVEAKKIYPAMYLDLAVSVGERVITCCGYGPTTLNNVYISATNLCGSTVVGISCVEDYDGFVEIPNDLRNRKIIEKSTGITGDFTSSAVKVNIQSGKYYEMILAN